MNSKNMKVPAGGIAYIILKIIRREKKNFRLALKNEENRWRQPIPVVYSDQENEER